MPVDLGCIPKKGEELKRIFVGVLFLLLLVNVIGSAHRVLAANTKQVAVGSDIPPGSTVLQYYDGQATVGFFGPLSEIVTTDEPAEGKVSPGPYPYQFSLDKSSHIYLQIRHFLWANNSRNVNHLTIQIDNESTLEAYSPTTPWPNIWYPGGDGVTLIDLGTRPSGSHLMTMTYNISSYYAMDWWKIFSVPTAYNVTFSESGLAQSTQWSVIFNNQTQNSTSNSTTFSASNGVYAFSITPPSGYIASPLSGSITVNGTNVEEQIMFSPYSGNIIINSDGSITPSYANITTSDNVTYGFTDDNYLPIVVNRSNIIINGKGHTLQASRGTGFSLSGMSNVTIENTTITHSIIGILLNSSSSTVLSGNTITANGFGIDLYSSSNNTLSDNNLTANNDGIALYISSGNVLSGNNLMANYFGIYLDSSSDNGVFHNNFSNNTQQVFGLSESTNAWDDGYPSGGNYWSEYSGVDEKSGSYQNQTGSDGVGDVPYSFEIDYSNIDRYPLMAPFKSFNAGTFDNISYSVDIVSNSTLSNFSFNAVAKTLTFSVTGANGSAGFSRAAIPKALMWSDTDSEWTVTVNGVLIGDRSIMNDTVYTYIYFTYHHSTEPVQIQSTDAVPEFQPFMLITLFMAIALLAATLLKKKEG